MLQCCNCSESGFNGTHCLTIMSIYPLNGTSPDFHRREGRGDVLTGLPRPVLGPHSEPGLDLRET